MGEGCEREKVRMGSVMGESLMVVAENVKTKIVELEY